MTRDRAIAVLRAHEQELRRAGVASLSLFGSVARDEVTPASDIDLAVRLAPGFSEGGFDYFGRFEDLRAGLAAILGCQVDLVEEPAERPTFSKQSTRTGRLPSEKPARRLRDILENADAIARYTEGVDLDAFTADAKTRDAVERCPERISEAARKLGEQAPRLVGDQPWPQITALGQMCQIAVVRV